MELMKKACNRTAARLVAGWYCVREKLREQKGASEYVGVLVLVLIAVVVGGIMMALFGDTIKEVWVTVKSRITDLFNYS